jgi:hypothetical protein
MNMPKEYPNVRVPMYIITIVEPTGRLVESGYKTRMQLVIKINEESAKFYTQPILDEDDYITQSLLMNNGNFFIITTTYVQIMTAYE